MILKHKRILYFTCPCLLGVLIFFYNISHKAKPESRGNYERAIPARTIMIQSQTVRPVAIGYGSAYPDKVWEAVSEVKGKVINRHPDLELGAVFKQGTVLLELEPTDYELSVARVEQDIKYTESQIKELKIKQENTEDKLEIEREVLKVAEKQWQRYNLLTSKNAMSPMQTENMKTALLKAKMSIQLLENNQRIIPAQLEALKAQLRVKNVQLTQAKRDLAHTVIKAPFDCRISAVNIEKDQFVPINKILLTADDISSVEVEAQIPVDKLAPLLQGQNLRDNKLHLDAVVKMRLGNRIIQWPATFLRLTDAVDPQTRTFGAVVVVNNPYKSARNGMKPPLVKGMYCKLELIGPDYPDCQIIPREAYHNGTIYTVDKNNRLHYQKIDISFSQSDYFVLNSNSITGQNIVVSDLPYAFEGMLIKPIEDIEYRQSKLKKLAAISCKKTQ